MMGAIAISGRGCGREGAGAGVGTAGMDGTG